MSKMIQIRNVPDDVHRTLKIRAAQRGMTLSDYLKQELEHMAQLPTLEEIYERIDRQETVHLDPPVEDVIREMRGE
jgi:plasmid stability protein